MEFLWGNFGFICVYKVESFQKKNKKNPNNIPYVIGIKDEEGTDELRGS